MSVKQAPEELLKKYTEMGFKKMWINKEFQRFCSTVSPFLTRICLIIWSIVRHISFFELKNSYLNLLTSGLVWRKNYKWSSSNFTFLGKEWYRWNWIKNIFIFVWCWWWWKNQFWGSFAINRFYGNRRWVFNKIYINLKKFSSLVIEEMTLN